MTNRSLRRLFLLNNGRYGFGLEGRHLRAFRTAAEREVGLFSQIVDPMVRQRGSEAKARAEETVRELAALSVRLHAALVQIGLREVVGGA
ncbi:MAG: hypothetical protein J0H43_01880 [Actinobacteria bacterium]|nr:hypothetical protein [Actinomycetota bacterium]